MIQAILFLLLGLLTTVYLYFHYTYNYWIKKGIPQETPSFIVGNLLDAVLNKKNIGWIYNEIYFKYKNYDAVGLYEIQTPKLLVRNPDIIENIVIKDFSSFYDNEIYVNMKNDPFMATNSFVIRGEKWKPARNSLINGLTNSKLKDMYEIMKQTVPLLKSHVDDQLDKDIEALELAQLFMMTNISNTIYGISSNCFRDRNSIFHKMINLLAKDYWQSWWKVIIIFYLQRLRDFLGFTFIPKQVSHYVENVMRQVIDDRLKNKVHRRDYLNYYLNSNKPPDEKITEIICNGMTFFIAGYETSSLPSSNLMRELALNPCLQEDLYQELEMAYGGKSELDYDTLMTLPLLDKAFKETLRKYPLMYGMYKTCTKPTTLKIDGVDVKIEKGIPVFIPTYAIHHDLQYYPDPEVFDPERFSEEAVRARHPCTYLPFGAGPRICAGMKFGVLQTKLLLATIVYNYRIERTDRTPTNISMKKSAFLCVPEETQWIRLVKRK